jgi:hypothetical protein
MTRSTDKLLAEIEAYLVDHSMSATAFGAAILNDRHLLRRLRAGGSVTLDTADRIRAYMEGKQRRHVRKVESRAVAA